MKCERIWHEHIPQRDEAEQMIHCITVSPNGNQILVACGKRVLVYDANDGILQHSLKGHKNSVYAVAYSADGKRFASGGADKNVYIWTSNCEGILKYTHKDSIQCLAYNPKDHSLASGTAIDFGLWSPTQKSVQKTNLKSKCCCMAWTNDGLYIALGLFNGHISIRDVNGLEKVLIQRHQPIWCMAWSPPHDNNNNNNNNITNNNNNNKMDEPDTLAVGCWDQTLSFFHLSGQQRGSERSLGYDPMSLTWYDNGEYILCGGSDRKVSLYTKTGHFLKVVCETSHWVSALAAVKNRQQFAVGRLEPLISFHHTIFGTVHGLYQDRYAYRDTMTEVIIQHLITEQKVRIKIRDYVKKIAVYKDLLAIQLPGRILIYQCESDDDRDMHYLLRTKIEDKLDCNLLVITTTNLILCHEKKLQLYDFHGKKLREWRMNSIIRYMKVLGGPTSGEGLLIGQKDGTACKIFINNQFPIELIKHPRPIRCLDLNTTRTKVAIVDEQSEIFIYDVKTKEILFQDTMVNSVAWNTEMDNSLCYSGNGQLSIKTNDFPVHKQPLAGFVVGFKGCKIFCLHNLSMKTVDVPQSDSMYMYMDRNDYESAYKIACLGVTQKDWQQLANRSLKYLSLDVARKCFIRLRENRYIDLLERIEAARLDPNYNDKIALADIYAYQGKIKESTMLYVKAGLVKKATEILFDLGEWNQAKQLVAELQKKESHNKHIIQQNNNNENENKNNTDDVSMNELFKRQGTWLMNKGETVNAADLFWSAKEYKKSIELLGNNKYLDELIEKVRLLTKSHRDELIMASTYFKQYKHHTYAKETLLKLEDYKSLVRVHIDLQKWDEAFELAKMRPELAQCIYEPYAESLALKDQFEEAEEAFIKAGKPERAMDLLRSLTKNAISEHRYVDAAYYFWKLAVETLRSIKVNDDVDNNNNNNNNHIILWPPKMKIENTSESIQRLEYEAGFNNNNNNNNNNNKLNDTLEQFRNLYQMSNILYAYEEIFRFTEQPFTPVSQSEIFMRSQMVLNYIRDTNGFVHKARELIQLFDQNDMSSSIPFNISMVRCLYAFAEIGHTKGAYKSVRTAYDLLQRSRIPHIWKDRLDINSLKIRNKKYSDPRELQPECFRCGAQNAIFGSNDRCQQCNHQYIRNFDTFDILPLVEFFIENDINEEEAKHLINRIPYRQRNSAAAANNNNNNTEEYLSETTQTLHFNDDDDNDNNEMLNNDNNEEETQFLKQLISDDITFPPITLNRQGLLELNPREVYICSWNHYNTTTKFKTQYFKCVIADSAIIKCQHCHHFFDEEDFEKHVLKTNTCPVCRIATQL